MFDKILKFLISKLTGYTLTHKKEKYDKESNNLAKNYIMSCLFEKRTNRLELKSNFLHVFKEHAHPDRLFDTNIRFLKVKGLIKVDTEAKYTKRFDYYLLSALSGMLIDEILNEEDSVLTYDLYTQINTKRKNYVKTKTKKES